MELIIKREDLLEGIQIVQAGVGNPKENFILGNILLESTKEELLLTTTDLEISIKTRIDIKGETEESITIPARKFSEIIRGIKKEWINLKIENQNRMVIFADNSTFYLNGLPKDRFPLFPNFPEQKSLSLPITLLTEVIKKVIFAVGINHPKYILNGVYFLFKKDGLTAVAIDGYRLALINRELTTEGYQPATEYGIIIPPKILREIPHIFNNKDGSVDIFITQNQIGIKDKKTTTISKLIVGDFLDYKLMIPKEQENKRIRIRQRYLLDAVRRMAIMTSEKNRTIEIHLDNNLLSFKASSPDIGEAKEEIRIDYKGERIKMGFNPNYLLEALTSIEEEELIFSFGGPSDPLVLKTLDNNQINVIMPIRL